MKQKIYKILFLIGFGFISLSCIAIIGYRIIPPPITPIMIIKWMDGNRIQKHWVDERQISPYVFQAVIASEDNNFCHHIGFDISALKQAWAHNKKSDTVHGASTITMQTAKNLFLWPDRTYIRKIIEAYFTVGLEFFLSKQRIILLYLNIIEWGNGIYGIEMAAQNYFHKSAQYLNLHEASWLAAILPNPIYYANLPFDYLSDKIYMIEKRISSLFSNNQLSCYK
ncbi:MAG: monofunctional biosynthetic peptidoglycan transglycosylase [Alphaproteobacteria bacterium]|nr:monofunctional biosynthetic peptidoglycan transglycosylase [Alphaproteobacteria bacterium]